MSRALNQIRFNRTPSFEASRWGIDQMDSCSALIQVQRVGISVFVESAAMLRGHQAPIKNPGAQTVAVAESRLTSCASSGPTLCNSDLTAFGLRLQVRGSFFLAVVHNGFIAAVAHTLVIPRRDLDGTYRSQGEGSSAGELVVYDRVPGGAGYVGRIRRNSLAY